MVTTEERFWSKVDFSNSCWTWTAGRSGGYGSFHCGKRHGLLAHRFSYFQFNGNCPPVLDHLCRNRACVRPDHLEAVSHKENIMRGIGIAPKRAAQSHCVNGHEFTKENTYHYRGGRQCRACNLERTHRFREKARAN